MNSQILLEKSNLPVSVGAGPQPSLSKAESIARDFYDRWIGESGLASVLGRLIFRLSGAVYTHTFVRVARLTPEDKVAEIGCGMGTILTAAQKQIHSEESYLGIDLSYQMIFRANRTRLCHFPMSPVQLMVGSALLLPINSCLFDVVLFSHVIKYLSDEQLLLALLESARVLKPGGRLVLWEFNPVLAPLVTRLVLRSCKAQKLRCERELRKIMEAAGYSELQSFRIITPWLPWSNIGLIGRSNGSLFSGSE